MDPVPAHLIPVRNDRGFSALPDIEGDYGGSVRIYESSSAEQPKIWLRVEEPNDLNAWAVDDRSGGTHDATLHMTAETAWQLKQQIEWLITNHYQGDARPDVQGGPPRAELEALVTADFTMLPREAIVASVRYLAEHLLAVTP